MTFRYVGNPCQGEQWRSHLLRSTIEAFASQKGRENQPIRCSVNMYCTTYYLLSIQQGTYSAVGKNTGIQLPKADSGLNFSIVGIHVNSHVATLIRLIPPGKK